MKYKLFPWLIGFLLLVVIFFASFSAPTIMQVDPAEKQNKVTFNAPFTLHFSHIMNRRSVEDAFMILPKTEGDLRWKDFKTLEFVPDGPLTIGDEYRIVIKGRAKNIWMKEMGYDATIDYLVTGPPYVLFMDPSQGELITAGGAITVMFDRAMDWDDVSKKDLIQIEPSLSGEVRFIGMSAFQFMPKETSSGQSFEVTIPAGLKALDGGETEESYSWVLMSPDLKVEKSSPINDLEEVALNEPLWIYFNDEVSLDGIKPGVNALLYPSNDLDADTAKKMDGFFNTEVTYGVNDDGETQKDILIFAPTFDYQPNESYRFLLKSDKDLPLEEDFELIFETIRTEPKEVDKPLDSTTEEVTEVPSDPSIWESDSVDFFIRGENPRLRLSEKLKEPITLSACQIPSNHFIRTSAKHDWPNYKCDTDSVVVNPIEEDPELILNLNDYFDIDWVTGVYLAYITQGENKFIKHFMIEDSTLLMKRSDSDLLVWALDVKSGEPIADMELEILSYDGEKIDQGTTDELGIYKANQALEEGIYVRGKKEEEGMNRWGFVSDSWTLETDNVSSSVDDAGLLVFLNQYVFPPGDTIKIKGIWRSLDKHVLDLPEATQVTVTIEDRQQNFVISKRIPLRRNGSFDGTIVIPDNIVSGNYLIVVSDINHQRITSPVAIQIKSDASDLKLEWIEAERDHAAGTAPVYIVKARYENGIPAVGTKGYYELYQKPSKLNYQEGAINYTFQGLNESCEPICQDQTLLVQKEFEFDLNGEAKLILTDGEDKFLPAENEYDLQVSASLPGRESAGLNRVFKVHQGYFDLGLGLKHALVQVNEAIEVSVLALDYDGEMIADKKVKLSLSNQTGKKKVVYEDTFTTEKVPSSISIPVGITMEDGIYLLKAESQDEKHNKIMAQQLVFLSTNAELAISDEFVLAADQNKYFVGGRAHLLINESEASEDNPVPVVVTYERNGLLGHEAMHLTAPVTRISVPIKETMMPHFLVTVTRFHRGISPSLESVSQRIDVGNDESKIFVDVSYEPELAKPGDEVTVRFKTYDYQNRPLASVITLNVLDAEPQKKSFSYDSFYSERSGPLNSASNITPTTNNLLPDYQNTHEKLLINSAQSQYFDPLISTTVGGEAEVSFTLPMERQDYFIEAIATKGSEQFGSSSSALRMNQLLLIEPILPSFAVAGDQTVFAASIKNISSRPVQSRLELISNDTTTKGDTARNFLLQPGQQTELAFNVYINDSIDKELIEVKFQSGDDLSEASIPLQHLKSCMRVQNSGLLGDIWTGRISLPKDARPELGELRMTMSSVPLAIAKVQSDALGDYHHDSTYLLAAKLLSRLYLLPDSPTENDLASVRGLVSSLLRKADQNGSYRFWDEENASPTLSAFALLAYAEASNKGIHVDSIQLNRTIDPLWKSLDRGDLSTDDDAFILWVLGKKEQYDTQRALSYFQERETLSLRGKAFLLLNLNQLVQAGQGSMATPFATLKAEIVDEAIQEEDLVYFSDSAETTAVLLFALSELDSANSLLEPIANYMVFQGGDLIRELNPSQALWTIMALKSYVNHTDHQGVNYIAQLKLNGDLILDQSVTDNSSNEVYQTSVEASALTTDDINDIFVKKSGTGPLYLDAHLISYLDPALATSTEEDMLIVRQLYEMTEKGERIPAVTLKIGKKYVSELEIIVPKDYQLVALSDEIPAGLKHNPGTMVLSEPFTQSHKEFGRITYFAPYLPAGVYKISTEFLAILPGTYLHLPATIQPMFEPTVIGRTEGGTVQIID